MSLITTQLFGPQFLIAKPAQELKETLAYLTDVMQAYGAAEQRLQLRSAPRQSLEYGVPLNASEMAGAFNTQYGAQTDSWAVPLWAESQYVGTLAAGESVIVCDTLLHDLRAGSLALLRDVSGSWQVCEIDTVTAAAIALSYPTSAPTEAYLIPLRLGHATNISTNTNGYNSITSVRYQIDDNLVLSPAAPAQYLADDVYYESFMVESALQVTVVNGSQITDYDLGAINYRTPWANCRLSKPYGVQMRNAQEVRNFRNFFARRAGKYRQFWMPTFQLDMRKAHVGNVANQLTIWDDDYTSSALLRKHIAIQSSDQAWHPFIVNSVTPSVGGKIKLNLNGGLGIDASRIINVSYMGLHRLDTDSATLNWLGASVAQTSLSVVELSP